MLTKNDLSQIKTVVLEIIQPEIKALKKGMATKDDLKGMASKIDLRNLEARLTGDIKGLTVNMKSLEKRLIERTDEAQMEIIATVDKHKADKEDIKTLGKRVDRLEDNVGLPPYADQ